MSISIPKPSRVKDEAALDAARRLPCVACGAPAEACHIKSRGAGGPDEEWNLLALCRKHHTLQHSLGWREFLLRYPQVQSLLQDKGWTPLRYEDSFRLFHPKLGLGTRGTV